MQEIIEEYLEEKYKFLTTKVEYIDIRKYKILIAIRVYDVPIEFEIIYVWDTHYTNYTNLETIRERIEKRIVQEVIKMTIEEKINHSTITDTEIIVWNEYFSIIKYKNDYIFFWADKDLRR